MKRKNAAPGSENGQAEQLAVGEALQAELSAAGLVMPDLVIVYRDPRELTPNPRNANKHPKSQIELLAKAFQEYGFTSPVLINSDDVILAGHGRHEASLFGKLDRIPTICISHLSAEQQRAMIIADNAIAERSSWDKKMLGIELADLKISGFDLLSLGFTKNALDGLLPQKEVIPLCGLDDLPDLADKRVSGRGDVWLCGRHRIMCGDAVDQVQVAKLTAGAAVDVVLTDPALTAGSRADADSKKSGAQAAKGAGDHARGFAQLIRDAAGNMLDCIRPDAQVYVFVDWRQWSVMSDVLESSGLRLLSMIVWDKGSAALGAYWRSQHDLIWFGSPDKPEKSSGYPANVIHCKRIPNALLPSQQPVDLLETLLGHAGPIVLDLFVGSGSTVIACEKTKRTALAMDKDPKCIDIAVRRWQTYTGQAARLESTGQTFEEISHDRTSGQAAVA